MLSATTMSPWNRPDVTLSLIATGTTPSTRTTEKVTTDVSRVSTIPLNLLIVSVPVMVS